MNHFFNEALWIVNGTPVTAGKIILAVLVIVLTLGLMSRLKILRTGRYLESKGIAKTDIRRFFRRYMPFMASLLLLVVDRILNVRIILFTVNDYELSLRFVLEALFIILLAWVLDWIINHLFIQNYFSKREERIPPRIITANEPETEKRGSRLVQNIVYLYGGILLIQKFGLDYILFSKMIKGEKFTITLSDILMAVLIMLIARLLVWFITQITLYGIYRRNNMDEGSRYAVNQLVAYVIYTIALLFALDQFIPDMKIIYGGAAALLVGIGLGLQQTFNDFFSGLVLLFERTVMVGDVVEMGDRVGKVKKIGLRASLIETRKNVSLLVPNSKLTNDFVVNWTHYSDIVRFEVDVSVAYGSDTRRVEQLLLRAADENTRVLKKPAPFVRFNHFGESGLQFTLYYFSEFLMNADDVKSDLRFEIDRLFREQGIVVPFPQRDVWLRR
ncbi:MAG: mechanosensitive ion channel [Saprospiraceae bacterium]|nr:mechanosensitive ion channel [Saprospiraceae bacterium]